MKLKKLKALFAAVLIGFTFFASQTVQGQEAPQQLPAPDLKEDFEQKELEGFVRANEKVVAIEQSSQQEMIKEVEGTGLTVARFNELANAQQSQDSTIKVDSTEQKSFDSAIQKLTTVQQRIESKMIQSIKDEGIDVETYQQIAYAYQKSPKVKEKIDALLPEPTVPEAQQPTNNQPDTQGEQR